MPYNGFWDQQERGFPHAPQQQMQPYARQPVQQPGNNPQVAPNQTPAYVSGIPQSTVSTVDPSQATAQILAGLAPQFQMGQRGLSEALANAGIMGGQGIGAQTQLGLQQQSQATGEIAPLINSDMQFNAGAQNSANQFDIGNLMQTAMFNAGGYNNAQQFYAGMNNQDWLQNMMNQYNMMAGGAGAKSGYAAPIYQQPGQGGYQGWGQFFGQYGQPGNKGNQQQGTPQQNPTGYT